MSQKSKLVNDNGSISLNNMELTQNGEVNEGLDVKYEERQRKLTRISMGSDSEEPKSNELEELEEDNDVYKSKAQKLNEAVMTGNVDALSRLLEQKSIDVNMPDSYGRAPLHNAILRSDVRMVEMLLEANADINLKDDREDTPMHFAARSGNTKMIKVLLSHPECDVNVKGSSLNSPLHLAACQNRPALCKLLVERGAKINSQEENGKTPLGRAVETGANESAQYLLQYMTNEGMDIMEQLYDADYDGTTLLHLAVDSGFLEVVKLCVEYGAIIRQPRRKDRMTAFHLACEQGSVNIVKFLVEKDNTIAKILLVDSEWTTPLHKTARSNSHGIAEILIDNGAEINARDINNSTPLMAAAKTGATETVQLLMVKGADPTVKDVDGKTAVFNGIGHSKITEILLQDPVLAPLLTEKDNSGHTVAHYAAMKNDVKSMALFLKHNKAVASVTSDSLDTPLHVAAQYGNHEVIRVLIEKQAGKLINAQNNRSRTALHLACRGGHYRAAMLLLQNSAGVEKDQSGRTPLHEAAKNGAKKVVEMIVEKHIHCLNYVDEDKNTALHLAVIHCRAPIISFLLSLPRQEILKNSSNQNILDAAMCIENPIGAMTIAEHPRWREVLESCTTGVHKIFKLMVTKMPDVAERLLDNCIETEGDKSNQEYKIRYDLGILLRKRDPNDKSSLEILQHIADNRCEKCLTHRVSFIALCEKWNSYGWIAFLLNICCVLIYLIPMTVFHSFLKNNDETYCSDRINYTASGSIVYLDVQTCVRRHMDMQIYQIVLVVVIVVLHLTVTLFRMYRQKLAWLTSPTNIIELVAYLAALISLLPTCECKWGIQKEAAATGLFFGWINLIMYLQRLPFYGKYVIMLYRMFITLIKVLLLFGLFVFAFGTTFHQMLTEEPFNDLSTTMMNMFIMTLGEINYVDVFMPWNKLYYPFLANLVVVMFCLTMPIILMNMLVGLSVGDIDKIEQTALIDRYVLQVTLLNSIENSLPSWVLKRIQKKVVTIYPNKRPFRSVIFDALIGFGKVEEIEEEKNEEVEDLADSVKELHYKVEEHAQTMDEMKVMLKEMLDMMKQVELEKKVKVKRESIAVPALSISGLTGSLGSAFSFGLGGTKKTEAEDTKA
ncbi:transient receptor potential cation channel subfamily A member 1-like [Actinia tenebrosa]|uniref:Transient receptor potential cation channel subfamily A member 1-like n=1 Tax=Actinia tenebrosa TaxID=6105 RepID=A0A6P8H925_ACTTE|nr:transient receptor potential cation channel subfamily A member 1-like [Actinia tenebrosa]